MMIVLDYTILINQILLKTKRKATKKKKINSTILQKMSILNHQKIYSQTRYFNLFLYIDIKYKYVSEFIYFYKYSKLILLSSL